jgi:GNAT superfamily N-acetyltransferase
MCLIRPVKYIEILGAANASELLAEYAAESAIPEIGPTCPQALMYAAMENSGMFHAFGAFRVKLLVGFAAILTYTLPHYGRKIATVESLFVSKEHRGNYGRGLMNALEKYAREDGCAVVLYSAPAGGQLEKVLSLRKSYRRTNSVFCRSLH